MMRRALLLLLCMSLGQTVLAKRPDFPAPKNAQVSLVGDEMSVNGILSRVRSFYTKDEVDDVADFYRKIWEKPAMKDAPGFTETYAMLPWILMARIEDKYLMTVQFQPADQGGSWGYLAISPLPKAGQEPPAMGKGIPSIRNSKVVSEVKSRDPGQTGRSVIISNEKSISSNVNFYRNYYLNKGWASEMDDSSVGGKMVTLSYKRGRKRVTIVLMGNHSSTSVVINDVSRDLL